MARELYERMKRARRTSGRPAASSHLPAEEIEREFLAANPWLKPDMISVSCRNGNLLDIRVCFGRDLAPAELRAERGPEAALQRERDRRAAGQALMG